MGYVKIIKLNIKCLILEITINLLYWALKYCFRLWWDWWPRTAFLCLTFIEVSHCNHCLMFKYDAKICVCMRLCANIAQVKFQSVCVSSNDVVSVSFQFNFTLWSYSMDPLGARSQFVEVQNLSTWDQPQGVQDEVDGENHLMEEDDQLTNQLNSLESPFTFRQDINSKIVLLWVLFILTFHKHCFLSIHGFLHYFNQNFFINRLHINS